MTAIAYIADNESGLSVLNKINSVIDKTNENNLADLREAMVDSDKTFTAGFREVYLSAALTGAKTLTLPLASAFPAGTILYFIDEISGVTSTNTVTITCAGSDTVNGLSTYVIGQVGASASFVTDGTSKWTGGVFAVNQALIGGTLKLTAGDITTTSDTAGSMTGISFPLEINSRYKVSGLFAIACNGAGGVKFACTLPASATVKLWMIGRTTSATALNSVPITASATLTASAFQTFSGSGGVWIDGEIATGATAGTFQMQYASGTNTQTSTIQQLGTSITIEKIA